MKSAQLKLTDPEVRQIKLMLAQGVTVGKITAAFPVSKTTISLIKSGARYAGIRL